MLGKSVQNKDLQNLHQNVKLIEEKFVDVVILTVDSCEALLA